MYKQTKMIHIHMRSHPSLHLWSVGVYAQPTPSYADADAPVYANARSICDTSNVINALNANKIKSVNIMHRRS